MIWPFLMLYASQRLELPMATIATLLTINAVSGIASSFVAGPIIDRFGRKWMMVGGLALHSATYLMLSQANTLPEFVGLMALSGAVAPLYMVGADAMLADLVPTERRTDAYALMRLSANAGIAIGPAVGGVLISISYNLAFYLAAAGLAIFGLLMLIFSRETMPPHDPAGAKPESFGGYLDILRDQPYMRFLVPITLGIPPGVLIVYTVCRCTPTRIMLCRKVYMG
jgi:MFS family permease